jgi:hypothetical protein
MSEPRLEDLLSEKEVYEKYGRLLADRELREARQRGLISWFDLRKGPHYTADQIMAYFKRRERQICEQESLTRAPESGSASSRSATIGWAMRPGATTSSTTGMTPELEERAARLLESET